MNVEIIVKGVDRLAEFLKLVHIYDTPSSRVWLKVDGEEGAALIINYKVKVKILTYNWSGEDLDNLPDKNRILR